MKISAAGTAYPPGPPVRTSAVKSEPVDRFEPGRHQAEPPVTNRASMQAAVKIPSPHTVGADTPLGEISRLGGGAMTAGLGVVQAAHGLEDLEKGNLVDGLTDSTAGTLNAWGGTALVAGSTVAAPVAMAVAAGLDGGRDIMHGIQSHDHEKVAVGGVKTLGAGMLGAAPFLTSSLVGAPVGVALGLAGGALYAGASLFQNRTAIGQKLEKVADWAGQVLATTPMLAF